MARFGALFAAAARVMAVARGGSRYFYCPIMQLAMSSSCCASAHDREGDDQPGPSSAPTVAVPVGRKPNGIVYRSK